MTDDGKKVQEFLGQATSKAVETLTVWADANQRVVHELVELGASSAKEGVKLYAELQQAAIEALREGVQKAFKILETQSQALARSAERAQASAEQSGKGIQETCTIVVSKLRDVYAQN